MGEIDRWADIHPDILNEITKRFHSYDDHIPLPLVCKEWNLKLVSNEIPWLLLPEETFKASFDEEEEIYSLMHLPVTDEDILETKVLEEKGVYHAMLPGMEMLDILIRGSCYGWLITLTISEGMMQMLNPFTKMHFDLPPLSTFPNIVEYNPGDDEYTFWDFRDKISSLDRDGMHKIQVWKVVINSAPNNDNKDFMAVAIYGQLKRLAFYKPNNNRWSDFTRNIDFEDVMFFKEKIYAVDYDGQLYEFDTNTESGTMGGIYAAPPTGFTASTFQLKYLIGCDNGNILMLVRHFGTLRGTEKELETKKFDIYELRKGSKKWSRLHSLGNFIVLIGLNSSVQMLPTNFLGKGNQIYYTDDLIELKSTDIPSTRDIGIFDLKDTSFRRILRDVKYGNGYSGECDKEKFKLEAEIRVLVSVFPLGVANGEAHPVLPKVRHLTDWTAPPSEAVLNSSSALSNGRLAG
ncbi:hypothetical protein Ahy_B05g073919 [Arachis hypogaea]|uniref:KIB1-4 beta-propeller domain-containing protein n=1 Tax=Arachis hypogaea TaxID=3818 RepID=A0A444YXR9_ARAHY|nr:hypothetical protein Ahy_B05g073919 [Arachis hypogaea]